ncbi:hypothetical protein [Microbacterium istanbulense]|uniref:Uncharacterized protein n=1 Tax=Microbacterium istanbulense TaxID=3122049 RepID=A0ABU8LLI8_9MICO
MTQFTYPADPDFGVWSRAVDRAIEVLDLDWWPNEELVAELVAEHGLTDPDIDDQMQILEDELIALYSERAEKR